jgi:hypothetical protein
MTTLGRRWFAAFCVYVQHDFIASIIALFITTPALLLRQPPFYNHNNGENRRQSWGWAVEREERNSMQHHIQNKGYRLHGGHGENRGKCITYIVLDIHICKIEQHTSLSCEIVVIE